MCWYLRVCAGQTVDAGTTTRWFPHVTWRACHSQCPPVTNFLINFKLTKNDHQSAY